MKITVLMENTTNKEGLKTAHGLSLYIETQKHKILFDSGPNGDFADNAQTLGVNIANVDIMALSHGHWDHSGGMGRFMEENDKAAMYLSEHAFDAHYSVNGKERRYNGIDISMKGSDRYIFTDDLFRIDEELTLFSGVTGRKCSSRANDSLYSEKDGILVQDDFSHEQSMLIEENGKTLLLGGCAHTGIVNIMEKCIEVTGKTPDYVISGFHLYNPTLKKSESKERVRELADCLLSFPSHYYTCHCTGKEAFDLLKEYMRDKVDYLATGDRLEI